MINKKETVENFGYDPDSLSKSSSKRVCLSCDYCGAGYTAIIKNVNNSRKAVSKDSCWNCRFKKREEVSIKKNGVKNSTQTKKVRDKISKANGDRLRSESFKKKRNKAMIEKYGVKNIMESKELREQIREKHLKKYGVENPMQRKEVSEKAVSKSIETKIASGIIETIDGKTIPEKAKELGFSRSHFGKLVKNLGIEEALKYKNKISSLESFVKNLLVDNKIEFEQHFRVENRICDMKVENLLIECDGIYWHSDIHLDDNYHIEKKKLYIKHGYESVFFRSDEILTKPEIVKSILLNRLGIWENRFYARKCEIKEVPTKEAAAFLEENHLMGKGSGYSLGLYHNNNLVFIGRFRRTKGNNWDVSRMCPKTNHSVVGGYSRILKHFEINKSPDMISNFIDMRYGKGEYLKDLGFSEKSCYPSFKWTNGTETFHRMKFKGNSGYKNGMVKIWDCGQKRFEKTFRV